MFQLPYSLHLYYAAAERETATYGWAVVSAHGGNGVEFNGCRVFPADCTGFDPVAQTDAGPATTKRRLLSRSFCLFGEQHKFRQPHHIRRHSADKHTESYSDGRSCRCRHRLLLSNAPVQLAWLLLEVTGSYYTIKSTASTDEPTSDRQTGTGARTEEEEAASYSTVRAVKPRHYCYSASAATFLFSKSQVSGVDFAQLLCQDGRAGRSACC